MLEWTLYQAAAGEKMTPTKMGDYPTKREAMTAMAAKREPKTPIYRVGRTYTFSAQKGR